jgi:deazaflavin-dependent oxidoreductase (nitroreductase family)
VTKRRLTTGLAVHIVNPLVRSAVSAGVAPRSIAILETTGRRSGEPRRTPVGNGLDGDTFWIVAEHGRRAAYVRNIEASPRVRVKVGGAWRRGTARLLDDDDPRERQRRIGRTLNAAVVRAMGTELLSVRIDLDSRTSGRHELRAHDEWVEVIRDGLAAGTVAAVLSGLPSTVDALVRGADLLEAPAAAGTLLLPSERRTGRLVLAAVPVHLALSLGWALVLASVLPRRATVASGTAGGLAIAALDLGLVGRWFPRIRALPLPPQIADHVAFGAVVGAVVRRRRAATGPRLKDGELPA